MYSTHRNYDLESQTHQVEHYPFGFRDKRGREIGARIQTFRAEFTETVDGSRGGYNQAPGKYFGFVPWATRNGAAYGAVQHNRYFSSESERAQAIAKYLADAKKRAAKIQAEGRI